MPEVTITAARRSTIENRARACFRLAAHPATGEGERAAAMERGLALIDKYGLDPDRFDIPGRERREARPGEWVTKTGAWTDLSDVFASVFGTCAGCGAVASVGALCLACARKAEAMTCEHGRHGWCLECEGIPDA